MAGAAVPADADGDAAAHGRPPHLGRPRRPRLRPLAPLQATPIGKAVLGRTPILSDVGAAFDSNQILIILQPIALLRILFRYSLEM